MRKLLHLTSSLFDAHGKQGVSTQLSHELIAGLTAADASLQVQARDFAQTPIPYLDNAWLGALFTPAEERSEEQAQKVAFSDALIAELKAADVLVLGVPTYNFSVPAMLRSWADHVARAGVTFKYTDKGSVGLAGAKSLEGLGEIVEGHHGDGLAALVLDHLGDLAGAPLLDAAELD